MLVSGRVDTNKKGVLKKKISPASLIWLVIYRVSTSTQEPTSNFRDVKHRLQLAVIYQIFLPLGAGGFSPQLSSQQHQCLGNKKESCCCKMMLKPEAKKLLWKTGVEVKETDSADWKFHWTLDIHILAPKANLEHQPSKYSGDNSQTNYLTPKPEPELRACLEGFPFLNPLCGDGGWGL